MAKILIIDDDEPFCRGLAEAISAGGNETHCAHTTEEERQLAASAPTPSTDGRKAFSADGVRLAY